MNARTLSAAEALELFDLRNDSNGLFLRYCRGRLRSLVTRLAMSLTGAAGVALLADAVAGLVIAVVLALGEAVDSLVLRRIVRRWGGGEGFVPLGARHISAASAAFQALTVCIAVSVTWLVGPSGETHFYATAFLIGAAINAGLLLPHDPSSNGIRLLLFGCTLVALNIQDMTGALTDPSRGASELFGPVASLMLAYMTGMVIVFLRRTHGRRSEDARTILVEQARLEASSQNLDRASQEATRLALVARHANDAVILYSRDGVVEWINDGFTRMMGYAPDEVVGRRIEEAVPAPDADMQAVGSLIEARRKFTPCRVEFLSRHKSGRPVWIETSLTPVPGADGTPDRIIAVEREVTEAKAREAELARARVEAEEGARAKARFLATMSHEIRTPMNGVIGTAELLAETTLDRDQRLYVDTIVESGQALLAIINDILDLSRLQSGAGVPARDPFDLRSVLGSVLTLLTPTARAKGIALEGPADGGGLAVLGDSGRVRQILTNLIGNAIKFTEAGGVTVDLRIRPAGDDAAIEVAVADTGIGIPADRLEGVFESFTQADGEISRRFGGTGLGLTISRLLAREMDGDIAVVSEVGLGSVFTLTLRLPIARENATPDRPGVGDVATAMTAAAQPAARLGAHVRVLVVEDNRTNALIVLRMLAGTGARTLHVADGHDAISRFGSFRPHIVLMDLSMPGMTGFEAMRRLRAEEASRPDRARAAIVALTANAGSDYRMACLKAGFDGFLTKPVQKQPLLEELVRQIDGGRPDAMPVETESDTATPAMGIAAEADPAPPETLSDNRPDVLPDIPPDSARDTLPDPASQNDIPSPALAGRRTATV